MRRIILLTLPILLAGCAGVPAISTIAYLIDGASFVGTGKSVSDHALSAVAEEDCALWRVTFGEPICQESDGPPPRKIVAARQTAQPAQAARARGGRDPRAAVARAMEGTQRPVARPAAKTATKPMRAERSWPVALVLPAPVAGDTAALAATPRPQERLLELRGRVELLAEAPCPGADCPLPPFGSDG